jgi:splicing factor 45
MMASYGWKEGQGLGADASGRLDALSVARPLSSKNYKGKKKDEMIDTSVVTGMAKGRSAIIDSSRESRLADEAQRYGSASRVVVLTNLCAANEVDDDLGGEVAGEANKFGVVERAMVYLVPGDVRDEEAVRIFLVMSGLAGGWNSVKSFDGRHFGGRVVKARFYDEGAFTRGNYHL